MELLLWFVLTAYFIWRLYTVTKKRTVINQELSGTVFMLALGVLGEYMSHIYEEVKARPRYFIMDTLE